MLIYRKQEHIVDSRSCLAGLLEMIQNLDQAASIDHEQSVELLMAWGEFESAVIDATCPDKDTDSLLAHILRQVSLLTGHIVLLTWQGRGGEIGTCLGRLKRIFEGLSTFCLPASIRIQVPEGYSRYGLYPETYLEAARRYFHHFRPEQAVCIGLRSIGTSLSAVVAASLEELGCHIRSYTVRPRGHPFDRRILLSSRLEGIWQSLKDRPYLIIDEGPGLSGSSLCGTAQRLSELGLADDQIILFPGWSPDGAGFLSQAARLRWSRHRKYTAGFEDVWLMSGRMSPYLRPGEYLDISAGRWRSLLYTCRSDYPAVQPNHERRKYLCPEDGAGRGNLSFMPAGRANTHPERGKVWFLLKFGGLGGYGRAHLKRARQLSKAGFGSPVHGLKDGFLIYQFLSGRPLTRAGVSQSFLNTVAHYLSYVKSAFSTGQCPDHEPLEEMILVNVHEGLGESYLKKLSGLKRYRPVMSGLAAVDLDGRMLPHEWLQVAGGYLKADGAEHHDDHFFPGPQDIAWDLAASCIEFGLDEAGREYLIARYRAASGDRHIGHRLAFYGLAYLSFRLGYTTMAASQLGSSPDGQRFRVLKSQYSILLKQAIDSVRLRPSL